jgi:hypothetical protein
LAKQTRENMLVMGKGTSLRIKSHRASIPMISSLGLAQVLEYGHSVVPQGEALGQVLGSGSYSAEEERERQEAIAQNNLKQRKLLFVSSLLAEAVAAMAVALANTVAPRAAKDSQTPHRSTQILNLDKMWHTKTLKKQKWAKMKATEKALPLNVLIRLTFQTSTQQVESKVVLRIERFSLMSRTRL